MLSSYCSSDCSVDTFVSSEQRALFAQESKGSFAKGLLISGCESQYEYNIASICEQFVIRSQIDRELLTNSSGQL
ncbi:hypothetical protein QLX08_006312 [Tetragonisca angustula]|uniref:Uncharacterized protein n=1 Tax=Tetragonisca angustula TaxID=166442 RepID=A0AAW0ZWX0_9HYME